MSEKSFWNTKYAAHDCLFGDQVNPFLLKNIHFAPEHAHALDIGGGEGFNAILLAKQNFHVISLDISPIAQQRAQANARKAHTMCEFVCADIMEWEFFSTQFDLVTLFFVHVSSDNKPLLAEKIHQMLKPGGLLLLECFHTNQLHTSDIGPKDSTQLYTENELKLLYPDFDIQEMNVNYSKTFVADKGDVPVCTLQFAGLKK